MTNRAVVTSSVIFVSDLERSLTFYTEVFGCSTALHSHDVALMLAPGGFQIYLMAHGSMATHHSSGIGPHHLIWAVDTAADLNTVEQALKDHGRRTYTHTSGGVSFIASTDPDGIRVVVAHPSPATLPRSVISGRLFN